MLPPSNFKRAQFVILNARINSQYIELLQTLSLCQKGIKNTLKIIPWLLLMYGVLGGGLVVLGKVASNKGLLNFWDVLFFAALATFVAFQVCGLLNFYKQTAMFDNQITALLNAGRSRVMRLKESLEEKSEKPIN